MQKFQAGNQIDTIKSKEEKACVPQSKHVKLASMK